MDCGLFQRVQGIFFLLSWLRSEKVQQSSGLITRSLATLIEDSVIFVGVCFCMSRGVCLLNCLGMVTQKEQRCWLAQIFVLSRLCH